MHSRKTTIKHIVTMGDSLTDRGTMNKRFLWGVIPMSYVTGLDSTSPQGRFTNGYTWDDDFGAMLASMLIAKDFKAKHSVPVSLDMSASSAAAQAAVTQDDTDLADDIIDGEFTLVSHQVYSLNDDLLIRYKSENFLRSYAEGGLSAYDYRDSWFNLSFFQREVVSTLADKRKLMLADDSMKKTTQQEKSETLVVELSGANDLITVNKNPTKDAVDKAIQARMENLNELIKNGYSNFVLMGLPDISLTPKFQEKSTADQENIRNLCAYFNDRLQVEINKFQSNSALSIKYFDINAVVAGVYHSPEAYGFDPAKLKQPYTTSADFKMADGISHAPGYFFWDDVHPIAKLHAMIAESFYEQYSGTFDFQAPESTIVDSSAQAMCEAFIANYHKKLDEDRSATGGSWSTSHLLAKLQDIYVEDERDYESEMAVILDHAINGGGNRTRSVLIEMGWIDANNIINVCIPALEAAQKKMALIPDKNPREIQQPRI